MTNQSFWGLGFGRDPKLRAADSDREAAAERLRRSHVEGRLDTTELQQRLERCYEAKTLGELDELVTDLPPENAGDSTRPRFAPLRRRLMPLMPILIALIAICAVTGGHHFWLLIPLIFIVYRLSWWRWRPWRPVGGRGSRTWL